MIRWMKDMTILMMLLFMAMCIHGGYYYLNTDLEVSEDEDE